VVGGGGWGKSKKLKTDLKKIFAGSVQIPQPPGGGGGGCSHVYWRSIIPLAALH